MKKILYSLMGFALASYIGISSCFSATSIISTTKVAEALSGSLNSNGDWTSINFSDGTSQTTAGTENVQLVVFSPTTDAETGDDALNFHIPASMNGMNLVSVHAEVYTAGITGTLNLQVRNDTDAVNMLSTALTVDTGETGSDTAATAAVIDTSNDDIATNDWIAIDCDGIHTTASKGLNVTLEFRFP